MTLNQKMYQFEGSGFPKPRVYVTKDNPKKKTPPSFLVKCGCCEEKVRIAFSGDWVEVNGVIASKKEWKKILLPLLE